MKQNVHFQGITLTGAARELAEETLHFNGLERHMKRTVQITVQEIRRRMEALCVASTSCSITTLGQRLPETSSNGERKRWISSCLTMDQYSGID